MKYDQRSIGVERQRRGERGAALVIAIALLGLFATLGMLYVRHMHLERDAADFQISQLRVRNLAVAGVNAAIGELEQAIREDRLRPLLGKSETYDSFPTYKGTRTEEGLEIQAQDTWKATVSVLIDDESGKVNLNHASDTVLQAVLGVKAGVAKKINASLPHRGQQGPGRAWLLSVDDLLSRGLLTEDQFAGIDRYVVTTHTVLDHNNPMGFLNINSAPVEVMSALLGVAKDKTELILAARPFQSLADLRSAAEKASAAIDITANLLSPTGLPAAWTLESRCVRIMSDAALARRAGELEYNQVHARVEAVVIFDEAGASQIIHWNTQRAEEDENA